jgi:hypothetical protein
LPIELDEFIDLFARDRAFHSEPNRLRERRTDAAEKRDAACNTMYRRIQFGRDVLHGGVVRFGAGGFGGFDAAGKFVIGEEHVQDSGDSDTLADSLNEGRFGFNRSAHRCEGEAA